MKNTIEKMNETWLKRDYEQIKKEQSKRNLARNNSIACMHVNQGNWVGKQFKAIRG
jgi:hypothetical protein